MMSTEMDEQVNPLERDHSLCVVLPGGIEKTAKVHGSKPVMDLLVTLCASYHLNPSDYTVEILSPNKNNISFKPNSPIGLLEADKIVLKPKGVEEKIRRPYMPEATVRLLVNYNKCHKTVVRVNPRLPLNVLLPVVCDKCEFKVETTVLLRDSQAKEPLDLTKTLNDHGLREVFAKDTARKEPTDNQNQPKTPEPAVIPALVISPPPLEELPKKEKKQKENSGFLSLFRKKKKKHEVNGAVSAPTSPNLSKQMGVKSEDISSFADTLPADAPKKRRAPQPPIGASHSVPNNLTTCHLRGGQRSAESTLRSTKRRAPPPPCANTLKELQPDADVGGTVDSLYPPEELRESDESDSMNLSRSSPSSPHPSQSQSFSSRPSLAHLHEVADPYLASLRGRDLSDARSALAKVLTSSVSKGTLVKRLRNSTTFPKFCNGSSFMSTTERCPDNEVFCTELESVLKSDLPTENEWEDPLERRGLTTFKVVPPKKQNSHDTELTLDVPDQCQISVEENPEREASPGVSMNQTETEEDPHSPERSETETTSTTPEPSSEQIQVSDSSASPTPLHVLDSPNCPGSPPSETEDTVEEQEEEQESEVTLEVIPAASPDSSPEELTEEMTSEDHINSEDQREFIQSPNADVDQYSSCVDENGVEEEAGQEDEDEEDEISFPPPPPPVFFTEDIDVMEEEGQDTTASSVPSSQPPSPTMNGQTNTFSQAHPDESTSAVPEQPLDRSSPSPSRFAQAVAMAVQRSRLQSKGLGPQVSSGPHSALPSPPRTTYQYGA